MASGPSVRTQDERRSMLGILRMREITGRSPCSVHELPDGFKRSLDKSHRGMLSLVEKLERDVSRDRMAGVVAIIKKLTVKFEEWQKQEYFYHDTFVLLGGVDSIFRMLCRPAKSTDPPHNGRPILSSFLVPVEGSGMDIFDGPGMDLLDGSNMDMLEDVIDGSGQDELNSLSRILQAVSFVQSSDPSSSSVGSRSRSDAISREAVRAHCLTILRELCLASALRTSYLVSHKGFIDYLFELMRHPATFEPAVCLAREIFVMEGTVCNLSRIHDFVGLVESLGPSQLAYFCQLLPDLLAHPNDRVFVEESTKFMKAVELRRVRKDTFCESGVRNADRNHAVILSSPSFVQRLVKVLRLACKGRIDRGLSMDLRQLLGSIGHQLTWADTESNTPVTRANPSFYNVYANNMHKILDVLCMLVSGYRGVEVQQRLAALDIVSTLSTLYDNFTWHDEADQDVFMNHYPSCDCSPEIPAKTNILMLLSYFLDGEMRDRSHARMFLSKQELGTYETKEKTPLVRYRENQNATRQAASSSATPLPMGGVSQHDTVSHAHTRTSALSHSHSHS
eukprot:Rmarinus@m.28428